MQKIKHLLFKNRDNKLSKPLSILMAIHMLYKSANNTSNIFLSIFIWKLTKDLRPIIEYNLIASAIIPIFMLLGGWVSKRVGLRINLIAGMILYTAFYLFIFSYRDFIANYIVLLAIIRGASEGLYYLGFHTFSYYLSTDDNRDYAFGILGLINSLTAMLFPVAAGFMITSLGGAKGYEVVFAISFLMFLVGSVLSFLLPEKLIKSKFEIVSSLSLSFKNFGYLKAMLSETVRAAREPLMGFLISIIVFILVQKEFTVGNYSFWTFLASTFASYIGGVLINPQNRLKALLISSLSTAAISSIFVFKISVLSLWIFGIVNGLFINIIMITQNTISYSVFSSIPEIKNNRTETIVTKEIYSGLGRVISMYILYLVVSNQALIPHFLLWLGFSQIFVWVLLRSLGQNISTVK